MVVYFLVYWAFGPVTTNTLDTIQYLITGNGSSLTPERCILGTKRGQNTKIKIGERSVLFLAWKSSGYTHFLSQPPAAEDVGS